MRTRRFFLSRLTGVAIAGLLLQILSAAAQEAEISRINAYLNGLTTLEGSFTQINPDRSVSEGTFHIRKPGLMRFEYAPPVQAVVISDGIWVAVIDRASNQPANRYPLSETPLDILLRQNVDLSQEGWIDSVERGENRILLTAHDPGAPENGTLTLIFQERPTELREWIVTDEFGDSTQVRLSGLRRGMELSRALFSIEAEEIIEQNDDR